MSFTSYSGLLAEIAGFLNRADLTTNIPSFVTLCEAELRRRVDTRQMETMTSPSLTGETYSLPCDFGGVVSFKTTGNDGAKLEFRTPDAFDDFPSQTGTPRYYTITGGKFFFWPIPDGTITTRLRYRQTLPPLAENGTNWLLDKYPDAYLYGSLKHSAPFLMDDSRIGMWAGLFDNTVDQINREAGKERRGSTMQTVSGLTDNSYRGSY